MNDSDRRTRSDPIRLVRQEDGELTTVARARDAHGYGEDRPDVGRTVLTVSSEMEATILDGEREEDRLETREGANRVEPELFERVEGGITALTLDGKIEFLSGIGSKKVQ